MKLVGLTLIVLGLALAGISQVSAADGGATAFTLKGHTDGSTNYWTEGAGTAHNPTLEVPASTEITITASSATGVHTLKVGTGATSEAMDEGAAPITVKFTSPASGDMAYVCTYHSDMKGTFHVAGSATTTETKKSPGTQVVGLSIALVGAALLLRRK